MKSSAKKIELASVDDLFSTEEGRQDAKLEKIQEIPLSELHPFKNHPLTCPAGLFLRTFFKCQPSSTSLPRMRSTPP